MGFFDLFKRKSTACSETDLRETLISAVERQDNRTLTRLCNDNRKAILDAFPAWLKVPDEIKVDPISRDRYCQGLMMVASLFEQAGDPQLIAIMIGNQEDNPLLQWQNDLAAAQALIDEGQPSRAVELLKQLLDKTKGLRGNGVDHYMPRTFGMLGVALYHSGDKKKAMEFTRKAQMLCEEFGDTDGIRTYAANLKQMGV